MTTPARDNLRQQATGAVRWTILEKWGGRILTLVIFTLLARYVAPSEFGLISMAMVLMTIVTVFVDAGFARSLIQRREISDADSATAFWTSIAIAAVVYLLIFFSAPPLESAYGAPGLSLVLRLIGLSVLLAALTAVPAAHLERQFRFRELSIRVLIGNVVGGAAGVTAALLGAGVWALVTQVLITQLAAVVTLWAVSEWRPALVYSMASLRAMLPFGLSVMGITLMNTVQSQVDKFAVGIWFGPEILGYYFLAQRFLLVVFELVTSVMGRLTLTTFSKVQDQPERLQRGFVEVTFISAVIGVPIFALIAAFANDVVPVIFGPGWDRAIPVMQIFCASYALATVTSFDKNVLLAIGQPRRAFQLGVIENVVGIAVLVISAPFGIVAVAAGRLGYRLLIWPYRIALLRRFVGVHPWQYVKNVGLPAVALVAPAVALVVASATPWPDAHLRLLTFVAPLSILLLLLYLGAVWVGCRPAQRVALRSILTSLGVRSARQTANLGS